MTTTWSDVTRLHVTEQHGHQRQQQQQQQLHHRVAYDSLHVAVRSLSAILSPGPYVPRGSAPRILPRWIAGVRRFRFQIFQILSDSAFV